MHACAYRENANSCSRAYVISNKLNNNNNNNNDNDIHDKTNKQTNMKRKPEILLYTWAKNTKLEQAHY